MAIHGYTTDYSGEEIDDLLDKIDDLDEATTSKAGLMSAADKVNLDNAPIESLTNGEIENLLNRVVL